MAQIRKGGKKEVPGVNTSSLPDIVFMLLFFFMATTTMKEVTYKVEVKVPEATELQKLEKKSLTRYIYVGTPMKEYQKIKLRRKVRRIFVFFLMYALLPLICGGVAGLPPPGGAAAPLHCSAVILPASIISLSLRPAATPARYLPS